MKKILFPFLLLLIFSSCSKKETEEEIVEKFAIETLVGSWAYDTVTVNSETGMYPHREDCYKDHFIIRHNEGNWNDFTETIYLDDNCANQGTNLEWELKGDLFNLYWGEQLVITYKILSVTSNTLSFLYNVDIDNDGRKEEVTINAVKYDPFNNFGN